MSESAYTVVIHGKESTGKPTLIPALRAAGQVEYAREDENPTLEDAIVVGSFENFTLQLAGVDCATLSTSYTDKDGVHQGITNFRGLAAFYDPPVVDTGKKSVSDIVSDIIALTGNTEIPALSLGLSLSIMTTLMLWPIAACCSNRKIFFCWPLWDHSTSHNFYQNLALLLLVTEH
ncbi:hypothetical protein SNOG_04608 [Parastagonospora nodorum SN15]|uniref:Uncharacterized protein n=1 Tax=Phaeosphaeria nodorum (strain SN15 / ATCC MYA-4574 / FGSC 10173) TaxID=321614 RepID=Q0UUF6_PHANO|nr:hypothetical protein SNOG_04608 [Parastagonospora nodorum SN15]EAT88368.1 hypothetical protein SNOG_04608 [Parastagonospora nodorum SN15]